MPLLNLSFASGESSLSVRGFSVHEAVSSLFTASVWARSPDPSVDLASLVGKPAAFRIGTGVAFAHLGVRAWSGICHYAEQADAETVATGLSTYHLRIVPTLWIL